MKRNGKMIGTVWTVFAVACLMLLGASRVAATVLFEHVGALDPTTEPMPWFFKAGTAGSAGSIASEAAWHLALDSGSIYGDDTGATTFTDNPTLLTSGWQFDARINVTAVTDSANPVRYTVVDGTKLWQVQYNTPSTVVVLEAAGAVTITTGLSSGWHDHVLQFDPTLDPGNGGTVTLLLDGSVVYSTSYNAGGDPTAAQRLRWGQDGSLSESYWSLARFGDLTPVVVPEPCSLSLLGLGGLFLLRRWRRG